MVPGAPATHPSEFLSLAPSTISSVTVDSNSSGAMSLGSNYSGGQGQAQAQASAISPAALPSLETNLHKILARKIQVRSEKGEKRKWMGFILRQFTALLSHRFRGRAKI